MKYRRVFIAGSIPSEVIGDIEYIQEKISNIDDKIKVTPAGNIHITLIFLGKICKPDIQTINEITSLAIRKYNNIKIEFNKILLLPDKNHPQVISLKIISPELLKLRNEIFRNLINEKLLDNQEKSFIPHITIARCKNNIEAQSIDVISKMKLKKYEFEMKDIKLLNSELKPLGSKYNIISKLSLEKNDGR